MKRRIVSKYGSRRLFTKTADKVHKLNLVDSFMRGGIRL